MPIYEITAQNPEKLKASQMGMSQLPALVLATRYYDFSQLNISKDEPERKALVDVGGGAGCVISKNPRQVTSFCRICLP